MIRKTGHIISILMIVATLFSCRPKPIDIKIEPAPPKLVISSFTIPNNTMIVSVNRSFSALEDPYDSDTSSDLSDEVVRSLYVKDALVTVEYAGRRDTLQNIDTSTGIYISISTELIPDQVYTLQVYDRKTDEKIIARTTMMPQVSLDTLYPEFADSTVTLHYKFADPPGTANWYAIYYLRLNKADEPAFMFENGSFFVEDSTWFGFELHSDIAEGFNGDTFIAHRQLYGVSDSDTVAVMLSNISKEYFDFLTAYRRSGTVLTQLTSEPVNLPSNVENGFGFFNATRPYLGVLDLKLYK